MMPNDPCNRPGLTRVSLKLLRVRIECKYSMPQPGRVAKRNAHFDVGRSPFKVFICSVTIQSRDSLCNGACLGYLMQTPTKLPRTIRPRARVECCTVH